MSSEVRRWAVLRSRLPVGPGSCWRWCRRCRPRCWVCGSSARSPHSWSAAISCSESWSPSGPLCWGSSRAGWSPGPAQYRILFHYGVLSNIIFIFPFYSSSSFFNLDSLLPGTCLLVFVPDKYSKVTWVDSRTHRMIWNKSLAQGVVVGPSMVMM